MPEPKDLIISNFQAGVADSPNVGFGTIRNLDIYSVPGVAQINFATQNNGGAVVTDLVKWIVQNPSTFGEYWALGDTGRVYKSSNSGDSWTLVTGNTTGDPGNGLAIYKDYLFAFRTSSVDVYGPLSGVPAWTNSWQVMLASPQKPTITAQDDILYFGAGRFLGAISEKLNQTFNPSDSTTYSYNSKALTLPSYYKIRCLTEYGRNLMIGTYKGAQISQVKVADVFPWDRSSTSFNLPIRLAEFGVHQLININNILYIVAGTEHAIYTFNGYLVSEVRRLIKPLRQNITTTEQFEPFPSAIMNHKGRLFTAISAYTAQGASPLGVWSLKDDELTFEHQISTGTVSGNYNTLKFGAIIATDNDSYLVSWNDNANYGIDKIVTTSRYTGYNAYFESPLYEVGTALTKKTYSQMDFYLSKPLTSGQGVRISFRTNLAAAYTVLGTYDFATFGAIQFYSDAAGKITNATHLQIKCELTTTDNTSPRLKEIRLR